MINDALKGAMQARRDRRTTPEQRARRAESVLALLQTKLDNEEFEAEINISQPNVVMKAMPKHKVYIISTPLSKTCLMQVILRDMEGLTEEDVCGFINKEIPASQRHFRFAKLSNHNVAQNQISLKMNVVDEYLPQTINSVMHALQPLVQ